MANKMNQNVITEPSICIPRTLNNVSWRDVKETFETLFGKGTVDRVDIVRRRDDDSPFCRIFVHMRYWPQDNEQVMDWRKQLMEGSELKVVYKHPWYWKCVASRLAKPEKKKVSADPYIMTDESAKAPAKPTLASWADEVLREEVVREVMEARGKQGTED